MYEKTTTIVYKWDIMSGLWIEDYKTVKTVEDASQEDAYQPSNPWPIDPNWPTDWTEGWSLPEGPTCKVNPEDPWKPYKDPEVLMCTGSGPNSGG
jgi:hypothetical protein